MQTVEVDLLDVNPFGLVLDEEPFVATSGGERDAVADFQRAVGYGVDIKAAGLAVVAADTGRILMLQRSLDEDDPAAGTWEMPGGGIEDGEEPLDAAVREWQEETGCELPDGEVIGKWDSGVYCGYVFRIVSEAEVPLFDGRDEVINPDDPDSDRSEALAWWDRRQLTRNNPALRPELRQSLHKMLAALDGVTFARSLTRAGVVDEHGNLHSPEDGKFVSKAGGVGDAVANVADKLKLAKKAPAGFTVRSSRKLKTEYADVGVAEVDGPDGPQVRIGLLGRESGKWDAGFGGGQRKTQLREEIDRKQDEVDRLYEADAEDDRIGGLEDEISELESDLEALKNERTAVLTPEAMADLRRQLDDGLVLAKANKVKQDATLKQLDALDEKREEIIAEFGDVELERKISKASAFIPSKRKTIERLENGPDTYGWGQEKIAELLASHKADLVKHEAELAPLLARRAELMPQDARIRLEDLDRHYQALTIDDIDDIITEAEVSSPDGSRVLAQIWGSDDVDEDWVTARLYVLAPDETADDVTANSDDYGRFPGIKGLSKLIAGLDTPGAPSTRSAADLLAVSIVDRLIGGAYTPSQWRARAAWLARAAGSDTHPGDGALKAYWTKGEGLAKWINEPHRWTALYHHLKKHMSDEMAKRVAAQWFHSTLGYWPGDQAGENPVGPG